MIITTYSFSLIWGLIILWSSHVHILIAPVHAAIHCTIHHHPLAPSPVLTTTPRTGGARVTTVGIP